MKNELSICHENMGIYLHFIDYNYNIRVSAIRVKELTINYM